MRVKMSFIRLIGATFFFAMIWALPMAAYGQGFLSAAADIPLADGLVEAPNGVMVFDKPEGRIVQITANNKGTKSRAEMIDFYDTSLPNLGWQRMEPVAPVEAVAPDEGAPKDRSMRLTFVRKGEILRLTFTDEFVFFDLAPEGRS